MSVTSSGHPIAGDSTEENFDTGSSTAVAPKRGRGAASASARHGYRRFRNVQPKSLQKPLIADIISISNRIDHFECRTQNAKQARNSGSENVSSTKENIAESSFTPSPPTLCSQKLTKQRICKYFKYENSCYFGEHCRFLHISSGSDSINPSSNYPKSTSRLIVATRPNFITLKKDDAGKKQQQNLLNSEINYFDRRFPGVKYAYDGSLYFLDFMYKITDPEWAFDVKNLNLRAQIPEHYPCASMNITLNEPNLPKALVMHFDKKIKQYFEGKFMEAERSNRYMGLSKLFIRWLDHHVFELFVEGLRKTKLIVDAENEGISLQQMNSSDISFRAEPQNNNPEIHSKGAESGEQAFVHCDDDARKGDEDDERKGIETSAKTDNILQNEPSPSDQQQISKKEVIEARLIWNNLNGNIGTLTIISMALSIRCAKCHALSFMTCTSKQLSKSRCQKCTNGHSIQISPQLAHENSNVIALLQPKGCIPVDCVLLSSKFSFTCLQCAKEAIAENLVYGTINKSWCHNCHSRCEFEITSIRFVGNFSAIAKEDNSVPKIIQKKIKTERPLMLAEGQPLPEHGTCKHYKKSYRWFRFPCCGKLYPCDLCHNETEKEHEMKMANRIVCGFCSKEQLFRKERQCVNCSENVTRVKSQFWEGGKGCRNHVLMNRNDRKKHSNSLMKTVSKKHAEHLVIKKNTT